MQKNKSGVPSTRVYIAQSSTSFPSTNGQTHSLKPVSLLEGLVVQNGAQLNKSTTSPISPPSVVNRRESSIEPINLCNDQPIDLAVKSFSSSSSAAATTTTVPGKSLAMPTVKLVTSYSPTSQAKVLYGAKPGSANQKYHARILFKRSYSKATGTSR